MAAHRSSNAERRPASKRFGMYFLGVAIGLVMVGFLLSARRLMVQPAESGTEVPAQSESAP